MKGSNNPFPSLLVVEGTASSVPAAGQQRLYIDPTTHHLCRIDSSGAVTDIEAASGGGASTAFAYLLQTATGTNLPNAISVPGAAAWQDASGRFDNALAGGVAEEYEETTSENLAWTPSAPSYHDADTTVKSHLFASNVSDTTDRYGLRAWSPAGAFEARCHISVGSTATASAGAGLVIADATNANRVYFDLNVYGTQAMKATAYTFASGSYTAHGTIGPGVVRYLRITRDGANNWTWYYSQDGIQWIYLGSAAFAFTVAQIGYRIYMTGPSGNIISFASDWLRTNV